MTATNIATSYLVNLGTEGKQWHTCFGPWTRTLTLAGVTQPMLCCWFHYCVLCMLMHAGLFLYVAITFWAYRTALVNALIGGIVGVKVIFATVEVYLRLYCWIFHNLMLQPPLSKVLYFNLLNCEDLFFYWALFIVQTTEKSKITLKMILRFLGDWLIHNCWSIKSKK